MSTAKERMDAHNAWLASFACPVCGDPDCDFDCDGDYEDTEDDFDCGMMPDGYCSKAGSEECDWQCPRNG